MESANATHADLDEIHVFDLSEGITSKAGDRVFGLILVAVAVGWVAAMAAIASSAAIPERGRALVVVLALISVPLVMWARHLWRRARSSNASLQVSRDEIVITCPWLLTDSLRLSRDDIAAVVIDGGAQRRFAVMGDADWADNQLVRHAVGHLWTRGGGGALPLLSMKSRVPDCAILFTGSRPLPVSRGRSPGSLAPNRWPVAHRLEAGVMVCAGDPEGLRAAFADWPAGLTIHRDVVARAHTPLQSAPLHAPGHGAPDPAAGVQPAPYGPSRLSRRQASIRLLAAIGALTVSATVILAACGAVIAAALSGHAPLLLGVFALGVALTLVVTLWPRHRRRIEVGERLTEDRQPQIWRLTREAANTIGVSVPTDIRLTLWPEVSLSQHVQLPTHVHTTLRLGLPALALLTEEQLRTILAATLDSQRDHSALLLNVGWSTRRALQQALTFRGKGGFSILARELLAGVLGPINDLIAHCCDGLISAVARDGEEVVSRHWPGPLLLDGRETVRLAERRWDFYWHESVIPALDANETPSLAAAFGEWLELPSADSAASGLIVDLPLLEEQLLTPKA